MGKMCVCLEDKYVRKYKKILEILCISIPRS